MSTVHNYEEEQENRYCTACYNRCFLRDCKWLCYYHGAGGADISTLITEREADKLRAALRNQTGENVTLVNKHKVKIVNQEVPLASKDIDVEVSDE